MAKRSQYPDAGITREDILALESGEVVKYQDKDGYHNLLLIEKVDLKRGVVTGRLTDTNGVNAVPIEDIVQGAIDIASWRKRNKR